MRRIFLPRVEALWRSRRNGFTLLAALAIATTLGALALAGTFSSSGRSPGSAHAKRAISAKTLRALEHARALKQPPLYYLGLRFDGLPLVYVESDSFLVTLTYADCSVIELNTLDPSCRRAIVIDLEQPAPGEITTQGRCTYSARVRRATVALFPVNPHSLRVFTKKTTVYISSRSLRDDLAAARALQGLNVRLSPSESLPARDVQRQLGRCRVPRKRKRPPLTPKQRYQQEMQQSWTLGSAWVLSLPDLGRLADNRSVEQTFLADAGTFPLLLRNEANRLSGVQPPADVVDLQSKLVAELRAYADDVNAALALVRSGAWHDTSTYRSEQKNLEARFARHSKEILAIVASFQKRGYVIAMKPGD
ncbi:MAG: hypothetical protein ABSB96_08230 [Gaiellaceae bacterium]